MYIRLFKSEFFIIQIIIHFEYQKNSTYYIILYYILHK